MDAVTRNRKLEELNIWKGNLATAQQNAAQHGSTPPSSVANEIRVAEKNIKRIQDELDAGHEDSIEATALGLLELAISNSRRIEELNEKVGLIGKQVDLIFSIVRAPINRTALFTRRASWAIVIFLLLAITTTEVRNIVFDNLFASLFIIALLLALAFLLNAYSSVLRTGAKNDRV